MNKYPLSQASYLSNRGNVLLKLGRWEAAEKDISAAIDLSPDNAKVAFCICVFVNRTGVNFCLVQNIFHFVLRQKFLISIIIVFFYNYKGMICIIIKAK